MNNPVATGLVIYLGLGAIFIFWDMEVIRRLIKDLNKDSPNLPSSWIMAITSIGLVFVICTWPIWAIAELVDWIKSRKG